MQVDSYVTLYGINNIRYAGCKKKVDHLLLVITEKLEFNKCSCMQGLRLNILRQKSLLLISF